MVLGKLLPGRLLPGRFPPTLTLTQILTLTQGGICWGTILRGNFPVTPVYIIMELSVFQIVNCHYRKSQALFQK